MASTLVAIGDGLQPTSFLQLVVRHLATSSDGLHPSSDGLQPTSFLQLVVRHLATSSFLLRVAMASTLVAMASNLLASCN